MDNEKLEKLIEAARQHGLQSEPDHEVGDLQDILRTCWRYLKPIDRMAVFIEHKDKVDDWIGREETATHPHRR